MTIERSIQSAVIKETGQIIQSDIYFENKQECYAIRTEYNRDNITFLCLSCEKKLGLYKSIKQNFYLKHLPNSDYCELKEETLSIKEQEIYSHILTAKESPRHIFLKNRIGELLKLSKDVSNVKIDDYFIFNNQGEKRKPDVYCKYLNKEIVFEIQLSNLSQRYILGRHDFYKEKGIYLIWVLDNFDVEGRTTTELDIKHLSQHQNYFRFKDSVNDFQLNCKFKQTHLNTQNQFYDEWNEVNITLNKLQFDENYKEVYFYNFLKSKVEKLAIQKRNELKIQEQNKKRKAQKEQERIIYKIHDFLEGIASEKEKYLSDYSRLDKQLSSFSDDELDLLNNRLKINDKERLFFWLKNGKDSDYEFFKFILSSPYINVDINKEDKYSNNIFWYLLKNESIYSKERFLKLFFKSSLKFEEKDEVLIKNHYNFYDDQERIILICQLANYTPNWLISELFEFKSQRVLCVIESCFKNKIIGFKFKGWLALFNYIIHHYPEYWDYIERALKSSDMLDKLKVIDKKGTFQNKLKEHYNNQTEYNRDFNHLFQHLYPELCY